MPLTDEEFDRLIRSSDPATTRLDEAVSPTALALRDRIMARNPRPVALRRAIRRHRRAGIRIWPSSLSIAASAAVIVLLGIIPAALTPNNAVAGSPPASDYRPADASAQAMLKKLAAAATARREHVDPGSVSLQSWGANLEEGSDTPGVVQPQQLTLHWSSDLSGDVTITAGTPYIDSAAPVPAATDSGPLPVGTPIYHESYTAGDYPLIFRGEPPTTSDAMRSYLLTTLSGRAGATRASTLFRDINVFLSERQPTPKQESAIIAVLADTPGISFSGRTVDRVGRPGFAFSTTDNGATVLKKVLVISETGQIIAAETHYEGGDSPVPLGAGYLLDYTAWERTTK
ncbi:hypothetical protein ET475_10830 [Microbacterium protaetiae]|uniref:Uncharacterized protein n=1 Tax=Microbacterium protaetiae TaxID=2509458 RepID=A0A4P6EDU1_9MICO|nr:hypothetical protein [Microbacterium protaetiae]QAY60432.1 hypothetical protein ET475_10830 [Microbacterium protaetiae]